MKKLMNRAGLLAAAFALALAVAPALNAAAQTPAAAQSANASAIGSDTDGDGLIEITTLAQFNAMRWDMDGNGLPDEGVSHADQTSYNTLLSCPTGAECLGYELKNDISLAEYNSANPWAPIPNLESVFNGNGFSVTGLNGRVGLFRDIGVDGVVKNVNVVGANITIEGDDRVLAGALAATNRGTIVGSYASGNLTVKENAAGRGSIGGLFGRNYGKIVASVADVNVTVKSIPDGQRTRVGGFVGINYGYIRGSYAYGDVIDARTVRGSGVFHARGFAVNHTNKRGEIHRSRSYGDEIVKRGSAETKTLARFAHGIIDQDPPLITHCCALTDESEVTCPETPTPTAAPTPTATPTPTPIPTDAASNEAANKLDELGKQVAENPELSEQVSEIADLVAAMADLIAALMARIAQLEGGDAGAATATPTPTPTSVAGASGGDACIERLEGSGSVSGAWTTACLAANSPANQTYYARFYTFTLDAASEVTITLSSADAAPYIYLLDGGGTDGAINQQKGAAGASSATITASLQPGSYTIEATTYYSETAGDFTLELDIAQP